MQKNAENKNNLTRLQRAAVAAIVTTKSNTEAAAVAGCSERSIYKWLKDPVFKAELATYEKTIRDAVDYQLTTGTKQALEVIRNVTEGTIKDDPDLRASVRLRAAIAWMDLHIKTRADTELEARVSALEAQRK